jgi:hypothetical protein
MPALLRYTDIGPELQPRSVNAIYCMWKCPLYRLTDKRRRITPNQVRHRVPHLILVSRCRWICPTDLLDAPLQTTKSCLFSVALPRDKKRRAFLAPRCFYELTHANSARSTLAGQGAAAVAAARFALLCQCPQPAPTANRA